MTHKIKTITATLTMLAVLSAMPGASQTNDYTASADLMTDTSFQNLISLSKVLCQNQPFSALELAAQAKSKAESARDTLAMGVAYHTLGECYYQTRVYYMAIESYFKSFEIYTYLDEEEKTAQCLVDIAKTYYAQEVFDLGEKYCIKAINISQEHNCPEAEADALATLGQISIFTSEEDALGYMMRAKRIYDSLGNRNKAININISLAKAYTHIDQPDSALNLLDSNLESYAKDDDNNNMARTYLALADTYFSTHDYTKASTYYKTALNLFTQNNMIHDALECRTKLARLQYRDKNYSEALENSLIVLQDAQIEEVQHGTEEIMIKHRACYLIYNIYKMNGNTDLALQYCERFAQTGDSIFAIKKQEQFSEFQVSLESQQKEKEMEMLEMTHENDMLQLEKKSYNRSMTLLITVIALVIAVVIIYYRRYKEKLQNNTALALNNVRMEQEIQERKIAENELRTSEEKYHLLFKKTPMGIIQFNDKFIITAANESFSQIMSLKSKNIVGQDLYSIIPQKAFEGYDANRDLEAGENSKMFKKEMKVNTPAGEIYLSISIRTYRHNTGTNVEKGGIMIVEDITERKLADEHKQIYNTASNDIINILPESVFLLDSRGNYLFARIPNLPVSDQNAYIGKNIREMLRPDILLQFLVAFNTVRKTGEEQYAEYQEEDDPQCQIFNEARFVACDGGKVLVMVRDISRQKKAENKLKSAKNSAESGSKAKSEFILGMTTEIKTPLEQILRNCEELVANTPDNAYSAKLKDVLNTALFVNETFTDVLKLTEVEAGNKINKKTINPATLARDVFEIFRPRAEEKKLEYLFSANDNIPKELQIDEVRIRQIIFNLLANAVKFTQLGNVTLKVEALPTGGNSINLRFSVIDTGTGMSEEQITSIMSSNDGKTGLALARKMAGSLKGKLSVESHLGQGSVFTFEMPAQLHTETAAETPASAKENIRSDKPSRKRGNDSMREYISVLKFAVIPEYKNMKSDMSFDTLTQFINKFKEQSAHYHIDKGVEIADELLTNIHNYDISNITTNIRKLETYIHTSIKELQGE